MGRTVQGRVQNAFVLKPTDQQRHVLSLIYTEFQRTGRRPTYQWIDKLVDRDELQLRSLVTTMPGGLMTPDSSWGGRYWRPEDELLVTVKGLLHCEGAEDDLNLLARVLRYFADRERDFIPAEPHQAEQLSIPSDDVEMALGLSSMEAAKVFVLLQQFEVGVSTGSSHNDQRWSWTLDCEAIRKYRSIDDAESYLRARGDLPEEEPRGLLPRARRQVVNLFLHARNVVAMTRQRTPSAVGALLRHPLFIGITVAVTSTLLTLYLHRWLE